MKYKICNQCGKRVDINTNFCPNCKSQSFRKMGEVVEVNSSLTHRLFYWRYHNRYRLAKSKIFLIFVLVAFVIGGLTAPYFVGSGLIVLGIFAAIVIGSVGFVFHKLIEKPSDAQIDNSDLGLLPDLYYTLFYWQDKKTGNFVFSKTKAITLVIFIVCCLLSTTAAFNTAFMLVFALIFTVPAFIIGYVIHKLTFNPDEANFISPNKTKKIKETPKVETKKTKPEIKKENDDESDIDFRLLNYRDKIESLNVKFSAKDEAVRELIEKRFEPPQLTYTRFITSVDNAKKLFESQSSSALNIISLASEYSPRIKQELDSKVDILNTIISKMDELANELVITMDESKDEDVHTLIDDMDNLIDSVDDYK